MHTFDRSNAAGLRGESRVFAHLERMDWTVRRVGMDDGQWQGIDAGLGLGRRHRDRGLVRGGPRRPVRIDAVAQVLAMLGVPAGAEWTLAPTAPLAEMPYPQAGKWR